MIPTSKRFENKAWGAEWCTCPIQENIVGLSPNIAALTVRLVVGIHRTRSYSFKFFFKSGCVCEVISPDDDADVDDGYSTSKLYSNIFAASAQELSRTITIVYNCHACLSIRGRKSQSRKGKKVHKTLCLLLQCLICSLSQKWWHGMGCISGGNCKCSRPPSPLLPIITAATAS